VATHKSAAKRARQSAHRKARNNRVRNRVKATTKAFCVAVGAKDKPTMATTLETATRQLRRASSKGVLHKRTAARRVSRLVRAANKAGL
jgi:small subunit ribosomal protein S20